MRIYYWSYPKVCAVIVVLILLWALITSRLKNEKLRQFACWIVSCAAFWGILSYTVIGRQASEIHRFVVLSVYNSEFHRELLMNVFLYVPFGLGLPFLLSRHGERPVLKTVLTAFLISLCIEYWQYVEGTGIAQITDLVMNGLGTCVGTVSYFFSMKLSEYHSNNLETETQRE